MGFIKENIKKQIKPQWDELKRTAKSVFGVHKSAEELITNDSFKYYLVAEHAIQSGQDIYDICDSCGNILYEIKGSFWLGRHRLIVRKQGQKIGEIRKKLIAVPDIIEGQSERHVCIIYKNGEETNCVEAYRESKKQIIKIRKGWKLSYCVDNDAYTLKCQKNVVAQLNEASNSKYVIGYNDVNKEVDIVLLGISFFHINNAIMNK